MKMVKRISTAKLNNEIRRAENKLKRELNNAEREINRELAKFV